MAEKFTIISAGAGSGKTYRLTQDLVQLLQSGVRAGGIIATTFTKKAAAELQERVRIKLLEEGLTQAADDLSNAMIGTVHSLGVKLLKRFAFEAGVSPKVEIIAEEDQQFLFNQSLAMVLTTARIEQLELLSTRLGLHLALNFDWRKDIRNLTDIARINDFSQEVMTYSKTASVESLWSILGPANSLTKEAASATLTSLLETTIEALKNNDKDTTVKTKGIIEELGKMRRDLQLNGFLEWHQWLKLAKAEVAVKSREIIEPLNEFAWQHEGMADFRNDIRDYIFAIFEVANEAIREFERYKQQRGLIDYNDMEVQVKRLLAHPEVQSILREELDLLMVDEFQDTNPVQLEIFLKLSALAKYSVWVGDPKQSIYGFRGADPELMQAIITLKGGVRDENILRQSWRSREAIVQFTNAVFTEAFAPMPPEQVVLQAQHTKAKEPSGPGEALLHWHCQNDVEPGKVPGKPWTENCIAHALATFLENPPLILPKGEKQYRPAQAGDVAILCRSNAVCTEMAGALHRAGLKASISRAGLMYTAEAKLITACLRYLLNKYDSLAVAELLLLAESRHIEDIVCDRLDFLEQAGEDLYDWQWAVEQPFIRQLNALRETIADLSGAEILNLVLEAGDLRRIIARWGNVPQRLGNVEILRKYAQQYEDACHRLHTAASLGGFLLWFLRMEKNEKDEQFSGTQTDAVNILTYHKSKGLEWPVVVCYNLDIGLKDEVWNMQIHSTAETLDLDDLQKGRWVRYWINPYSKSNSPRIAERLAENPFQKAATKKALEEEIRLLYVGITRARDYLILPTFARPSKWLNRVCNGPSGEDHQVLDINDPKTTWEDQGVPVSFAKERWVFPKDFQHTERLLQSISFPEPGTGPGVHPFYFIDPFDEKENLPVNQVIAGKAFHYAPPLQVPDHLREESVLLAVKTMQDGYYPDYSPAIREEMATIILERLHLVDALEPAFLTQAAGAFYAWVLKEFVPVRIYHRYPLRLSDNGRFFETVIDLVLETASGGIILIQHYPRLSQQPMKRKAMYWAGWLLLSSQAIKELWSTAEVTGFIHFPLEGAVIPLQINYE